MPPIIRMVESGSRIDEWPFRLYNLSRLVLLFALISSCVHFLVSWEYFSMNACFRIFKLPVTISSPPIARSSRFCLRLTSEKSLRL